MGRRPRAVLTIPIAVSVFDDRVRRIKSDLDAAVTAVDRLTKDEVRDEHGPTVYQVELTLEFALICLDDTDPQLITEAAEAPCRSSCLP